ncbi:hypothetical protein P886_2018 [Alteromonadaceae bacterium 2753L.S.0a.02]|nr:hypothetical protein P886_2018 [Alteromonadaceae bacterium 2753L.S.0a.02]
MACETLTAFEGALMEMQCCDCQSTQHIKVRDMEPKLTRCHSCKSLLVVEPVTRAKPNKILIELLVTAVQSAVPVPTVEPKLKAVQL